MKYIGCYVASMAFTMLGWLLLNVQLSYDAALISLLPFMQYFPVNYVPNTPYYAQNTSIPGYPKDCHGTFGCTYDLCTRLSEPYMFCAILPFCYPSPNEGLYNVYPWSARAWYLGIASICCLLPLTIVWAVQAVARWYGTVAVYKVRKGMICLWYLFYGLSKSLLLSSILVYIYFRASYIAESTDVLPGELAWWLYIGVSYYVLLLILESIILGKVLHSLFKIPDHYWAIDDRA